MLYKSSHTYCTCIKYKIKQAANVYNEQRKSKEMKAEKKLQKKLKMN